MVRNTEVHRNNNIHNCSFDWKKCLYLGGGGVPKTKDLKDDLGTFNSFFGKNIFGPSIKTNMLKVNVMLKEFERILYLKPSLIIRVHN